MQYEVQGTPKIWLLATGLYGNISHVVHVEKNLFNFLPCFGIPIFIKILPESAILDVSARKKFKISPLRPQPWWGVR